MTATTTLFLYVADASASATFYTGLFDIAPVEANPVFAMVPLPSGLPLGLWSRDDVKPAPAATGGGSEIGFKVDDADRIDALHAAWQARGVTIALPPTDLPFGRSFVALDPDGHRLRVYTIAQAA